MILRLPASRRRGAALGQFQAPTLGGALLAPFLHAGAFVKGVLPDSPQRPVPRELALEET